jgi:hypothetical protein
MLVKFGRDALVDMSPEFRGAKAICQPNASKILNLDLTRFLDRAPGHCQALALHLPPDLVSAVDLHVGLPDPPDVGAQHLVPGHAGRLPRRIELPGGMAPVARRGDLQHLADRLDPEHRLIFIDEIPQDLIRRSSSAWAKNALANFRISLDRAIPCVIAR